MINNSVFYTNWGGGLAFTLNILLVVLFVIVSKVGVPGLANVVSKKSMVMRHWKCLR